MDNTVERYAKGRVIILVTFKVKFMPEFVIFHIIFDMATSNVNKMSIYNKKKEKPFVDIPPTLLHL